MKKKEKEVACMLYIGPSGEAVATVIDSIMQILGSGQEQETIREALDTLATTCSVNNTTITNCTFHGDTTGG